MTDGCLAGVAIEGTRTFSALPAGTTIWAVTDFIALWPPNIFEIVVTGNSGASTFIGAGASTFFAFSDPTGLLSVAFTHMRPSADNDRGNYTLDNIVTASAPATVPEPATLSLLRPGLVGLCGTRRRRRTRDA